MEIVNFFEKLAGRWFSQRTTHALTTLQSKAGKSDMEVAFLPADSAEVKQVCAAEGELEALCGLRIQQSSTLDGDTQAKLLTMLLVPLVPEQNPQGSAHSGTLLRSAQPDQQPARSIYTLEDEVLTIISDHPEARSTERLWFVTENFRMRTGMTELASGLKIASFCSEIRLGAKPPQAP